MICLFRISWSIIAKISLWSNIGSYWNFFQKINSSTVYISLYTSRADVLWTPFPHIPSMMWANSIKMIPSLFSFKNLLWRFILPSSFRTFEIHDPIGLELLTRVGFGLSYLNEQKLKHDSLDFMNRLCACNLELISTFHFLLRCHLFNEKRLTLLR